LCQSDVDRFLHIGPQLEGVLIPGRKIELRNRIESELAFDRLLHKYRYCIQKDQN
jgi:hypothetical protein